MQDASSKCNLPLSRNGMIVSGKTEAQTAEMISLWQLLPIYNETRSKCIIRC
jgi:hypothetical protein